MADAISSETVKAIIDGVVEKLRSPATPTSREDGLPREGHTDSDPRTSSSVLQGKNQWVKTVESSSPSTRSGVNVLWECSWSIVTFTVGEDRQKFGRVAGSSEGVRQKEEDAQRCT